MPASGSIGKGFATLILAGIILTGCSPKQYDWCGIREDNLAYDLDQINSGICLPDRPLTLCDILDVAFERNLDLLVKQREYEVQREIVTRDRLKMLPSLALNGEASGRNRSAASVSQSMVTGAISSPSVDHENNTHRWDLTATWNLLDFGLSYYRSRQEHNRALIACLTYQRTRQNTIYEIINEYWKAIVAKKAVDGAKGIIEKAVHRQENLEQQIAQKIVSELDGLRSKDKLISIQIQLQSFEKDYEASRRQLAALMGLPPCTTVELADVDMSMPDDDIICVSELEQMALTTRPELYTQDVQEKIMADEVRAALVQMFPNASLFSSFTHDADRFLIYRNWYTAGVRASWNLLSLPQHHYNTRSAEAKKWLARDTRMSLSIGVMTQVNLAYLRYKDSQKQLKLAQAQGDVKHRLFEAASKHATQGVAGGADLFNYEAEALFAEIRLHRAYAEMRVAIEQINNTIGQPLYFGACLAQPASKTEAPEQKEPAEPTLEDIEKAGGEG